MIEFLEQLRQKYGYDSELIAALNKIVPALISYYGADKSNIIYQALLNCEIHIQKEKENTNEYLSSYFGVDYDLDKPLSASAMHTNNVTVDNGIVDVKNIVYIFTEFMGQYKNFDFNNENQMATLVHEICHLIKSYGRTKIEGNKIIQLSGLMYEEYDFNGNKLSGEFAINCGIEEALNCYDEVQVMERILGRQYTSTSYGGVADLASELMSREDIMREIRKSQFYDIESWIKYLGVERAKLLLDNFDIVIKTHYNPEADSDFDIDAEFDRLLDEGYDMDEIGDIINQKIEDDSNKIWDKVFKSEEIIRDFVNNYSSKEQLDKFLLARQIADKKTIDILKQMNTSYEKTVSVSNTR